MYRLTFQEIERLVTGWERDQAKSIGITDSDWAYLDRFQEEKLN